MDRASYLELFAPGLIAGAAVAATCAPLSVLVVLRRLAFMGQGISHAAFGGIGVAMLLGLTSTAAFGLVAGFCVLTALGIAWISDRRTSSEDTVIGVFLVGSMALGAILVSLHMRRPGVAGGGPAWEDLLFGSLLGVSEMDALIAWAVAAVVIGALVWRRRPMLFWAFDEPAAEAFGTPTRRMKFLLMALLAVTTVVAMKLAGVVLATALLVLPGATALRLSERLGRVFAIATAAALVGVFGGVWGSIETDMPPGACIVGVLIAMFALTWIRGV